MFMRLMLVFLFGFLLMTSACRKKDMAESGPVQPADTTHFPRLFNNEQPKIMSDFETSRNSSIHGHLLTRNLSEIEPEGIGKGLFEVFSFISEYEQKEMEYEEINGKLDDLQAQDSILQVDINNLAVQMNYNTQLILNQLNNAVAAPYINDIKTKYSNEDNQGLRWYSEAILNYFAHTPGYDSAYIHDSVTVDANEFVNYNIYHEDLDKDFNGLNLLICPVLPMDTSCLTTFAKILIMQYASHGTGTQNGIMNTYMLLEYYFFTLFNYQFQAATVKMNVLQAADTLQAMTFWANTVLPAFRSEIDMFQQSSNYLLLNLSDYRNQARWNHDIAYSGLYMAPNADLFDAMARVQFRVAELYQAIAETAPVVYGSITVPIDYCSSDPGVSLNGSSSAFPENSQMLKSRIPYTTWQNQGGIICSPQNIWEVYNYAMPLDSLVTSCNVSLTPTWPHTGSGQGYGSLTPLWYNPRDPSQTSTVSTDSCSMRFASFCIAWQWGMMMSDFITAQQADQGVMMYLPDGNNPNCGFCWTEDQSLNVLHPLVAQWHPNVGYGGAWQNVQTSYSRSFGKNTAGQDAAYSYLMSVLMPAYSGGAVYLLDMVSAIVQVPVVPAGGGVTLYTKYSANYSLSPQPGSSSANLRIGYTLNDLSGNCNSQCNVTKSYCPSSEIYNNSFAGLNGTGFGTTVQAGTYRPSFEYFIRVSNSGSSTVASVQVTLVAQEVFSGYTSF